MTHDTSLSKKLFVIDTNVLIHDAVALFNFEENSLYISDVVLEELDKGKRSKNSEVARNARVAGHFIEELQLTTEKQCCMLGNHPLGVRSSGMLFFATTSDIYMLSSMSNTANDNSILADTLRLKHEDSRFAKYEEVILVTRDVNMRVKGRRLGIRCQDYTSDYVIDDDALVDNGIRIHTWEDVSGDDELKMCRYGDAQAYQPGTALPVLPNNMVRIEGSGDTYLDTIAKVDENGTQYLVPLHNNQHNSVYGITAKSFEQNYAINLCMDTSIEIVTLLGKAGSGKTLLAIACGLEQVYEKSLYKSLYYTRATIEAFDDLGFLPGDLDDKLRPWMAPFFDSLEVLLDPSECEGSDVRRKGTTINILMNRVKFLSLSHIRGRSITGGYIIIDEAQNLTPKQMKTLISRVGKGSKIVLMGNVGQIDTEGLVPHNCGIIYVVSNLRQDDNMGYVILQCVERSRVAAQGDALP